MMLEQYLRNAEKEENCSLKQLLTKGYLSKSFFVLFQNWVSSPVSDE